MEGTGQDGTDTPPMEQRIGDVQRQELLATALREDDTPAAAISIHTNKNVDGRPENFHRKALQSCRVISKGVHMFVTQQN